MHFTPKARAEVKRSLRAGAGFLPGFGRCRPSPILAQWVGAQESSHHVGRGPPTSVTWQGRGNQVQWCVLLTGALRDRCSACSDGRKARPGGHRRLKTVLGYVGCSTVPEEKTSDAKSVQAVVQKSTVYRTLRHASPRSSQMGVVSWDHSCQWTYQYLKPHRNLAYSRTNTNSDTCRGRGGGISNELYLIMRVYFFHLS